MSQYELLLAHPSLCSDLESQSLQTDMLKQQPANVLRYTTAVDVLAPVLDMAFFQDTVVDTLQNATFGELPHSKGTSACSMYVMAYCCFAALTLMHNYILLECPVRSCLHLYKLAYMTDI